MKARNIVMIVVVAALFVAAAVFLVVGITTHEEPGFTSPDHRWAQSAVPLSVGCRSHAAGMEGCDAVEAAVEAINDRLGFAMLAWRGADSTAAIRVVTRAPVDVGADEPGGDYELRGGGSVYEGCEVWTRNVHAAGDLEMLTAEHELGHCLGLAHDDYEQSIMFPDRAPTPARTLPPWISDHDRALLRARYGGDDRVD